MKARYMVSFGDYLKNDILKNDRFLWTVVVLFLLFGLLEASSGRYYIDDLQRSLFGTQYWGSDGRPVSTLFFVLSDLNIPLIDISPLPQLLAAILMSGLALVIAHHFKMRRDFISAIILSFTFMQPFFLQNLAYHFDSETMALAVFLAGIAIAFPATRIGPFLAGSLCLYLSLGTYQAGMNIFLMLALFEAIQAFLMPGRIGFFPYKKLFLRAIQLMGAILIYKLTFARLVSFYARSHSSMLPVHRLYSGIIQNDLNFLHYMEACLRGSVFYPCVFLLGCGGLCGLYAIARCDASILNKLLILVGFAVGLPLCVLGMMPLLAEPVIDSRTLIGFGFLVAICAILFRQVCSRFMVTAVLANVAIVYVGWSFLVVGVAFRNAEAKQAEQEGVIASLMVNDIGRLVHDDGVTKYITHGREDMDPVTRHYADRIGLIDLITPYYLDEFSNNVWLTMDHYGLDHFYYSFNTEKHLDCNENIVVRNRYYWIYRKGDVAYVDFTRGASCH